MLSVHSEVLSCLAHLSLPSAPPSKAAASPAAATAARLATQRAKKSRRREVQRTGGRTGALDDALLARDLAEGKAELSHSRRAKFASAILASVFAAYLALLQQPRRLQTATEAQSRQYARIIPLVMQGVERFAPHINVDLLLDLLTLLQHIVDPSRESEQEAPGVPLLPRSHR